MINLSKIDCVGCTSCSSICPNNVILMKKDNEGFFSPVIVHEKQCVQCGLCEKACPVLNNEPEKKNTDLGYIAQIRDEEIRKESASGGMFSAIAISVLREKGVVFGAAYADSFEVTHIEIDNEKELWRLRNSKYVQSNIIGVFARVKELLNNNIKVCFSGTPCQIEGLKHFLLKEYDNLILVDVVCHGVSSPLIWEKYLETKKDIEKEKIYFRWKHYGYKYSTMSFFDKKGSEVYYSGVESDKMLRAYFSNSCDRKSCYNCVFKKRYRVSDFTIWDCFQPRFFNKSFDDDKGTSCVLIYSEKGKKYFDKIVCLDLIKYFQVPSDDLTYANKEMVGSVKKSEIREELLQDANIMPGRELFDKYFGNSAKTSAKRLFRIFLLKTKLYSIAKYCLYLKRRKVKK